MPSIAERLKEALSIRNMRQAELAEITKIGKSSISTYLSGEYEPKQKNIYKMARALDVSEAWLMGLDVPMERVQHEVVDSRLSNLPEDALIVALKYNEAQPAVQFSVRKLLDIDDTIPEREDMSIVARGGVVIKGKPDSEIDAKKWRSLPKRR